MRASTAAAAAAAAEDQVIVDMDLAIPEVNGVIVVPTVIISEVSDPAKNKNENPGETPESEVVSMLSEFEETCTGDTPTPTTGSCTSGTTGSDGVLLGLAEQEKFRTIILQVIVPFLISGCGMVGAGFYLDHVKDWDVFNDIQQLFILIPALVGLKGNLEMSLACRLSTQANLGNMNNMKSRFRLTFSNLCLVQCQAIVLSLLASIIALLIGIVMDGGKCDIFHALVLFTSSLATASIASFILGVFTSMAVIISSICNINPDNIAAPLAACLGDIVTLFLLSNFARFFHGVGGLHFDDLQTWIMLGVLGLCLLNLPICIALGWRSGTVRALFKHGWLPIIVAVFVSSLAGVFLEIGMKKISMDIAVFQPLFCGIGGNIAAIHASRLSTLCYYKMPTMMEVIPHWFVNPMTMFRKHKGGGVAARALLVVAIPIHVIFFIVIESMGTFHTTALKFIPIYLVVAIIQIALMLYFAETIVNWIWQRRKDPDSEAIPYLTAFGDVLGLVLLGVSFYTYDGIYGLTVIA